jgi:4'-phosphopantetheinyl transferase
VVVLHEALVARDPQLCMPLAAIGLAEEPSLVAVRHGLDCHEAGETGRNNAHGGGGYLAREPRRRAARRLRLYIRPMASEQPAILPREQFGPAPVWSPGPLDPQLVAGALHIWRVDLDAVGAGVAESLDDAERERAEHIVSPRRRELWSRSRGALRTLLGRYLRVDPSAIELTAGMHGKPRLRASHRPVPAFNLSHSASLALFAFIADGEVGVDLEVARAAHDRGPDDARLSLALRRFGANAAQRLARLDRVPREREFLRLWVRDEAECKWRGTGIGVGDTATADQPSGGGRSTASGSDASPWVTDLDVGPRAAAALALGARASQLLRWEWT